MLLDLIRFETEAALPPDDPVRMDGACFVGLLAERRPVAAGAALAGWLERMGYLPDAEKAAGPVEVASLPLPATLPAAAVAAPLTVVVNGQRHEIVLSAADTPETAAEAINAAAAGVEAWLTGPAGARRLTIALARARGPGRLAVLAHPGLGFPDAPSGPATLIDRPVPVHSIGEYEALFDGAARLDRQAAIIGLALPATLAPADVAAPLAVVVDGVLHEIALGAASTPQAVVEAVNAAARGVEARLTEAAGERRLVIALPLSHGPGTLAVLAYPSLGFPEARHARARGVPTVMDVAIRQFFAMGGRMAHVVSLGPPLPLLASRAERAAALGRLMGLGALATSDPALLATRLLDALPAPHAAVATLSGVAHLMALDAPAMLLVPDLPDLVACDREEPAPAVVPPAGPVVFADCVPPPTPLMPGAAEALALPETDTTGLALWRGAVGRMLRLVSDHRRDLHLVAAVPRAADGADVAAALPDSAFLLLAGPFLRTPASAGLPQRAMPACAVLAGQIAAVLNGPSPWGSAAAQPLAEVLDIAEPAGSGGWRVCWVLRGPRGAALSRDITASSDPSWRAGPSSRIAARLLREAAVMGQDMVFEPIDARLMRRVVVGFERVLGAIADAGGLKGAGRGFSVVCDRTLMTAADIDNGILRAEVTFRPAAPIEAIRVVLPIGLLRGAAAGGRA